MYMTDRPKFLQMTVDLYNYLIQHGNPPDALQQELIEETKQVGDLAIMQIAPEQGVLMTMLARLIGAKRAIEVGTFTGYSALCIARGLQDSGYLLCCDVNEEWTAVAQKYWKKAGVAEKIDLRLAPALETLRSLPETRDFDMAFLDADKENQNYYYEEILKRIRPGGIILLDNALLWGQVIEPHNDQPHVLAVKALNKKLVQDPRVECVMLPISDGLTLLRVF